MNRVYFDNNATTEPHPEVLKLLPKWAKSYGNASSVHQTARDSKIFLREARKNVASIIRANPIEIIFTSGGSESNNSAVKGVYFQNRSTKRNHYLVSQVEHPSVLESFEFLKRQGAEVEHIKINKLGHVDLEKFEKQIRTDTVLVSCMLANNETGHIYPIKKMAKLAHTKGALFHTDAVQTLGKLQLDVKALEVDFASFSGHKFYSLKGIGFLFVKSGNHFENLIHGGGQERNRRAGTENILAISSLGYMCGLSSEIEPQYERLQKLRDYLESKIESISGILLTGKDTKRLPNTSNFMVEGCDGETLLMNLDIEGISISTGAACSSGSQEPSPALRAMGWTRQEAQSSLRISLGWQNTKEEVDFFIEKLNKVVSRVRGLTAAIE